MHMCNLSLPITVKNVEATAFLLGKELLIWTNNQMGSLNMYSTCTCTSLIGLQLMGLFIITKLSNVM